jgi:hypothetical protein
MRVLYLRFVVLPLTFFRGPSPSAHRRKETGPTCRFAGGRHSQRRSYLASDDGYHALPSS